MPRPRLVLLLLLALPLVGQPTANTRKKQRTPAEAPPNPVLQLQQASRQGWTGGAAGSGGGAHYGVSFAKDPKAVLGLDRVWMGGRQKGRSLAFKVRYQGSGPDGASVVPAGVRAFLIEFEETYPGQSRRLGEGGPQESVALENPPSDLPNGYTHGAVIFYQVGKRAGTCVVPDFRDLPHLNFP